jgi:hypothetical protein
MKYSIIMPYAHRPEPLNNTLLKYIKITENREDVEVLIIAAHTVMSNEEQYKALRSVVDNLPKSSLKVSIKPIVGYTGVNPAAGFIQGALQAEGDYLIITQPECMPLVDTISHYDAEFSIDPEYIILNSCMWAKTFQKAHGIGDIDNVQAFMMQRATWKQMAVHTRDLCWCLAMKKDMYIGGLSHDLIYCGGFWYDDDDFRERIKSADIQMIKTDRHPVLHQPHGKAYTKQTPVPIQHMQEHNRKMYTGMWAKHLDYINPVIIRGEKQDSYGASYRFDREHQIDEANARFEKEFGEVQDIVMDTVIAFKKSDKYRHDALIALIKYMDKYTTGRIIVVEQDTKTDIAKETGVELTQLHVDVPSGLFNKSLCYNTAFIESKADYLFFLDADTVMYPECLLIMHKKMVHMDYYYPYTRCYWVDEEPTKELIAKGLEGEVATRPRPWRVHPGGGFAIKREAYLQVGGMDSLFKGYGGEDILMCWKMKRFLRGERHSNKSRHLYHPRAEQTKEGSEQKRKNVGISRTMQRWPQEKWDEYLSAGKARLEAGDPGE